MQFLRAIKNQTKLIRKRPIHRMKIAWNYYLNRQPKKPVFILASRRTGSNLLLDYLISIPNTSFQDEILNTHMYYGIRRRFISKKAVLRHILHSIHSGKHTLCGAKLIAVQMRMHGITPDDLRALFPDARFIILYRKSILDQYISLKIAEKTNVWRWVKNGFSLPDQIDFDPQEFKQFCDKTKAFYTGLFARPWIADRSVIVSYEDLTADPQGLFDKALFPFLGVPSTKISCVTRKQNTKTPEQIIRQYEQVLQSLDPDSVRQDYSFQR